MILGVELWFRLILEILASPVSKQNMTFITSLFEKGLFKFNAFTTVIKQYPWMKSMHVINIILWYDKASCEVLSSLCVCPCHQCCHHFVSVLVISVVITLCLSLSSVLSSVLSSLCICPCHQCCHHFVSVIVINVVISVVITLCLSLSSVLSSVSVSFLQVSSILWIHWSK